MMTPHPPSLNLLRELRRQTRDDHREAEAVFSLRDLLASRDGYAQWLKIQHRWLSVVEPGTTDLIELTGGLEALDTSTEFTLRRHWLDLDLQRLGKPTQETDIATTGASVETHAIAPSRSTLFTGLGRIYVVLGSAMGARLILNELAAPARTDWPRHFLEGGTSPERMAVWRQFAGWLDRPHPRDAVEAAVAGARDAFASFCTVALDRSFTLSPALPCPQ
jgi:heme oxygenase